MPVALGSTREAAPSHRSARLSSSFLHPTVGSRCPEPLSARAPTGDPRRRSGAHRALSTGSHSLKYMVTTTASRPGLQNSHVIIVGYVDYTQYMRFDSDGATQRFQMRGPWMKQMGPAYLEMERQGLERYSHRARENLRFAIQIYNQSDNGE